MNLESLGFEPLNNFEPFYVFKNTIFKVNFLIEYVGVRG